MGSNPTLAAVRVRIRSGTLRLACRATTGHGGVGILISMEDTQYIISPRIPVRGFFVAAVVCVIGAALLVTSLALDWHIALGVVGGALIVLGVLLMVVGFLAMRAGRSSLLFTEDGYELVGPGGEQSGTWQDVTRVTQTRDGRRITIQNAEGGRAQLVFAPGAEAQFDQMLADMVKRLDHAKGYRNF